MDANDREEPQIYADKTEIRIAAEERSEKDEKGIAAKSTKNIKPIRRRSQTCPSVDILGFTSASLREFFSAFLVLFAPFRGH
jgi:hypothetical protein